MLKQIQNLTKVCILEKKIIIKMNLKKLYAKKTKIIMNAKQLIK